jgi:hypothetical protein
MLNSVDPEWARCYTVCIVINKAHTIMIAQRVLLDITPRQAELVLESLRVNLAQRTAENREDSSDNQRIRAVIATIKEQL